MTHSTPKYLIIDLDCKEIILLTEMIGSWLNILRIWTYKRNCWMRINTSVRVYCCIRCPIGWHHSLKESTVQQLITQYTKIIPDDMNKLQITWMLLTALSIRQDLWGSPHIWMGRMARSRWWVVIWRHRNSGTIICLKVYILRWIRLCENQQYESNKVWENPEKHIGYLHGCPIRINMNIRLIGMVFGILPMQKTMKHLDTDSIVNHQEWKTNISTYFWPRCLLKCQDIINLTWKM